jgi:hypothetical protein
MSAMGGKRTFEHWPSSKEKETNGPYFWVSPDR